MDNFKYHTLNVISVLLFSYITAITINQYIKNSMIMLPEPPSKKQSRNFEEGNVQKSYEDYEKLLEKGFFKRVMDGDDVTITAKPANTFLSELNLLGTISGPHRIERAMIKKKGEKKPEVYRLWEKVDGYKITNIKDNKIFFKMGDDEYDSLGMFSYEAEASLSELSLLGTVTGPSRIARALIKKKGEKTPGIFKLRSDVCGYKLIKINKRKVFLKKDDNVETLDLAAAKSRGGRKDSSSLNANKVKKSISRSEIQQNLKNNLDNALRGLRAGPYRVDGNIEGFKIFRIRPYNLLYKQGLRSGDIVKRINGHKIDSTGKLYQLWGSLKDDSQISIDIIRGGKAMQFEFSITN